MRIISATVHDPSIYSVSDAEGRGHLLQFLRSAVNHHVMITDNEGIIRGRLDARKQELGPEIETWIVEYLKRSHSCAASDQSCLVADKVIPWLDCTDPDQRGCLAALALTGEPFVDGVVVSKETAEIVACANLSADAQGKITRLFDADRLILRDGHPLYGRSRSDIEKYWFVPVLKWGQSVTLVDKQVGHAFKNGNWDNFKLTIMWIYRLWSEQNIVKRRWFELLTHPPRDEAGKMGEPSSDMAAAIWKELGEHVNMKVTIVKEAWEDRRRRGGGDVAHERYINSMPFDFTLCVGRGFDLLIEGSQSVNQACTLTLLAEHPQDLTSVLDLRKSGVTFSITEKRFAVGKR